MKAFIVYCHPSEDSLTRNLRDELIKGIVDSGKKDEKRIEYYSTIDIAQGHEG